MNLQAIHTGNFKLDGGAMFGAVPKSIWQKTNPSDDVNLCTWALRCLVIEDGKRVILIDNGIGTKQDEKFLSHYHITGPDLKGSLKAAGYHPADVTDMFLTHLHFDHCGGGVELAGGKLTLTFPNATYWSNAGHWKWATEPNAREKPSFLKENIFPMEESGHLKMISSDDVSSFGAFGIFFASGHTDKMMIPKIPYKGRTVCFMADLLPSVGHIPLSYLMSYDTRPLMTLEEKKIFMKEAADNKYVLFLEHDPVNECCTVKHTDKGVRLDEVFRLDEL